MVHCIIQKRYFMYGNLHLHQNLSLKIIFIFIFQILYSSSVNVKDIYFVIGFILSRSKIRPKICQNGDSVHVFTSTYYIFYYLSENLLQFITSMYDKAKNLRYPNQDLVVGVQLYGLFLLSVRHQNRQNENEKKKQKRDRQKGRKRQIFTHVL